jgi:hypothetical protein
VAQSIGLDRLDGDATLVDCNEFDLVCAHEGDSWPTLVRASRGV